MATSFEYLVYIGRFQPFHNGHLSVLRQALDKARKVIIVLGSARRARNIKNPFTDEEREAMISHVIADIDPNALARLIFLRARDYYDDQKWLSNIREQVHQVAEPTASIGLIGYLKDRSTYYLNAIPGWPILHVGRHTTLSATEVRRSFFGWVKNNDSGIREKAFTAAVPTAVHRFLDRFANSHTCATLVDEFELVGQGIAAWATAPYPPVFTTVDVVLKARDHILMVRRARSPGKGQWALPGGFIDQQERLFDAAIRELYEETQIAIDTDQLSRSFVGVGVFDHPDRSVRGRTITHAHFFNLDIFSLPTVQGNDDAECAQWIPVDSLMEMERDIFEDHLHIVDHFLKCLRV